MMSTTTSMFSSVRLLMTAVMAAAAASLCSATEYSAPRRLLADSNSTTDGEGFFYHGRPSQCGYTCRVIVIAVGGGLLVLLLATICCCCCCFRCERRTKRKAVAPEASKPAPYEYHASPAVLTTAPSPVATSPYVAPNGTTAGYGVPAGRNTAPGTYNPRKF